MPVFLVSKPLRVCNIDQFSWSSPRNSNLTTSLSGIDHQRWILRSWAPGALDEVREVIECNDTDTAWRCWAEAIGFTSPTSEPRRLNEGWTCGKCHREVHKLWKRLRQFQSDCSDAGDREAREARDTLAALCDLLETHAASRLVEWKKTHCAHSQISGVASWRPQDP